MQPIRARETRLAVALSNKELDRTAHGCRPPWLAVRAAGQFRRSPTEKKGESSE